MFTLCVYTSVDFVLDFRLVVAIFDVNILLFGKEAF